MKVEIKHRWNGSVLFSLECGSTKEAVEKAVEDGANLTGANLDGANLYGANLTGANLTGANLTGANLDGANLYGANLYGANLTGANLTRANLTGANLTGATKLSDETRLNTGETFGEYKSLVMPALCTAGGKSLEEVAGVWECHSWENCPMQAAFDFDGDYENASLLVRLHRPRIEQFVKLFDSGLLPCPIDVPASCAIPTQS